MNLVCPMSLKRWWRSCRPPPVAVVMVAVMVVAVMVLPMVLAILPAAAVALVMMVAPTAARRRRRSPRQRSGAGLRTRRECRSVWSCFSPPASWGRGPVGRVARRGSNCQWSEEFQELASRIDLKRTCSTVQSIQWVYDNAGTAPAAIKPEEVPSHGSLRMLAWVQRSDADYGEFIRNIWSKTIPSKTEIERGGRFHDDGRELFSMLDDFEESLKQQAAAEAAEQAEGEAAQSGPGGE